METPKVKRPPPDILARIQSLRNKKGMIAAVEPESGEWFLGSNVIEAVKNARLRYPDSTYYFVRIGYPAAHSQSGKRLPCPAE